jgi:hypothetical protein
MRGEPVLHDSLEGDLARHGQPELLLHAQLLRAEGWSGLPVPYLKHELYIWIGSIVALNEELVGTREMSLFQMSLNF